MTFWPLQPAVMGNSWTTSHSLCSETPSRSPLKYTPSETSSMRIFSVPGPPPPELPLSMAMTCMFGRWLGVSALAALPESRTLDGSASCAVSAAVAACTSLCSPKMSMVTDDGLRAVIRMLSWSRSSASAMSARRFCLKRFWRLAVLPTLALFMESVPWA